MDISLKFVFKGPIENKSVLVQIIAYNQTRIKPLFEKVVS